MPSNYLYGLLVALTWLLLSSQSAVAQLTLDRVYADPALVGPQAQGVQLSPDGSLVTYLKGKKGEGEILDLWAADLKGGAPYVLIDGSAMTSGGAALSEQEIARRERLRLRNRGVVEYSWSEQGDLILVPLDGDLWLVRRAGGSPRRLTDTAGDEIDARISPRDSYVSFVRDQNLWVIDLKRGAERALTTEGGGAIGWGIAEFVAQEEMRRSTGYWWSPDERRIAAARVDESGVDVVHRAAIGTTSVKMVAQRYPRAGRPNASVELHVIELSGGRTIRVDLGTEEDIYLARVAWSRDGRTLYAQRQSRDQKRLDLLAIDPTTGRSRVILTETSSKWIELTDDFTPLADGRFLWSSERSGYRHLYMYGREGKLLRQVTQGAWAVGRIEGVDEASGRLLFSASKGDVLENHLWTVLWERPAAPVKLTSGAGWWNVSVARRGGTFSGTFSNPKTPPQTALYDRTGRRVRWIEENALSAAHPYAPFLAEHRVPEFGVLEAKDGQDLHYAMWTPPGFDPSRKYPVIVDVHGGPRSQQVRRRWYGTEDQLLLSQGYILFRLDNRGTGNRGTKFKTAIYHQLGTVEIEDQLTGVAYLKSMPFVDADRIGVMGWSYGGFMALMLMTQESTPFRAGAAGAAVSDWALYDTFYSERFMGTPSENPKGYAAARIPARMSKLKGQLLLLHGMADDNVTLDHATQVMSALQIAGHTFETSLYPGEAHVLRGRTMQRHLMQTHLDFFERRLKNSRASRPRCTETPGMTAQRSEICVPGDESAASLR